MPGYNRKGPLGAGPGTGRGRGFCAGTQEESVADKSAAVRGVGRGGLPWGDGRGRCLGGAGRRNRFSQPEVSSAASQETEALQSELTALKEEIAELKLRLEERDNSS